TKSLVNELNGKLGDIGSSITEANSDLSTVTDVWSQVSADRSCWCRLCPYRYWHDERETR
ncbi:MAG: hypothetical protein K8E24_004100, partial [Methanobacterium paludis]|nr:hypothetical protein [Methanobacterium paludis]